MKKLVSSVAATLLALSHSATAGFFIVFKASIMVPVVYVTPPPSLGVVPAKAVTKTLTAKEFINLTLGKPLDTPLNPMSHNYILALVLNYEQPTQPPPTPESKLVVWDTALPGDATVDKTVATIGALTELDFDQTFTGSGLASIAKGEGIATASIPEGAGDTNGKNKFFAVTLRGSGMGSQAQKTQAVKLTLTGLYGRVHFNYTDSKHPTAAEAVDVFGIAVKGSLTTAGNQIASF